MLETVTVRHLMSCDVHKVSATAPVEFVLDLLVQQEWQDIYVVDDQDEVLGFVPDYTLFKCWMHQQQLKSPVGRVMSTQFSSLSPSVSIEKVAPLYREALHDRIAVVDCGRLLGQLYRRDVISFLITKSQHLDQVEQTGIDHSELEETSQRTASTIGAPKFSTSRTRTRRRVNF